MSNPTPEARDAAEIRQSALQLLVSGSAGDEPLRRAATVGHAFPVLASGSELHSWFVPVTVGDRLVAFFQFLPDGTLMRFSSFQRKPGEYERCPVAADWIDLDRIQTRAAAQRREDESARAPFLTYDRTPDRLVWAVPLANSRGETRLIYVAGEAVYAPPEGNTFG